MWVIKYRKFFYLLSGFALLASLAAMIFFGLNFGIDFKGGTIVELNYTGTRPAIDDIRAAVNKLNLGTVSVQPTGDQGLVMRLRTITNDEKNTLIQAAALNATSSVVEKQFSSIGPSLGAELAQKAIIAISLVSLLIILFITFAFRGVSRPVSSWKYGLIAIATLVHDLLIPTGVFAYLGAIHGTEIDALFLTALLTILGLSVNDTIVVFDRIRENLKLKISPHFEETVGISLSQTFTRSINTSLTVILALLALYFFGGETTRDFALALTIGMIVGTYSSIFIASPLLVTWNKFSEKHVSNKGKKFLDES